LFVVVVWAGFGFVGHAENEAVAPPARCGYDRRMSAIHLICRRGPDGKFHGLTLLDAKRHIYESGWWIFPSEDDARSLVGGWVYLHPVSKNAPSEFGGIVLGVKPAKLEDRATQDRYVLTIESRLEGKKQRWRGADHGMAWTGGIVAASLPHEEV
jgi:hypothetical protein